MPKTELPAWCNAFAVDTLKVFKEFGTARGRLYELVREWHEEYTGKINAYHELEAQREAHCREHGSLYPDAHFGVPTCKPSSEWEFDIYHLDVPCIPLPESLGWFAMCGWQVWQERVTSFIREPILLDPKHHLRALTESEREQANATGQVWRRLDIGCWFPPSLRSSNAPRPVEPLPLEQGRSLSLTEKAVIVAAICNRVASGGEPIDPWAGFSNDKLRGVSFWLICHHLGDDLRKSNQEFIELHVRDVLDELQNHHEALAPAAGLAVEIATTATVTELDDPFGLHARQHLLSEIAGEISYHHHVVQWQQAGFPSRDAAYEYHCKSIQQAADKIIDQSKRHASHLLKHLTLRGELPCAAPYSLEIPAANDDGLESGGEVPSDAPYSVELERYWIRWLGKFAAGHALDSLGRIRTAFREGRADFALEVEALKAERRPAGMQSPTIPETKADARHAMEASTPTLEDPITLVEFALLTNRRKKTIQEHLRLTKFERPRPRIKRGGRAEDLYSYEELRKWAVLEWPSDTCLLPVDFAMAKAALNEKGCPAPDS